MPVVKRCQKGIENRLVVTGLNKTPSAAAAAVEYNEKNEKQRSSLRSISIDMEKSGGRTNDGTDSNLCQFIVETCFFLISQRWRLGKWRGNNATKTTVGLTSWHQIRKQFPLRLFCASHTTVAIKEDHLKASISSSFHGPSVCRTCPLHHLARYS